MTNNKSRLFFLSLVFALMLTQFSVFTHAAKIQSEVVDTIFRNGVVYTVDVILEVEVGMTIFNGQVVYEK
ncbi:MAG: hypothetical protein HN764_04685 [Gammaproteobacteria bacterium]|jgi:hypothetical protein|nr:hypothetical protein [Gammaproteobacteria bacterium]